MFIVTRLISDVHFHITGPKLTFKTYNYPHCDTIMSPKTADYFPSGGVIATLLGKCKVLCYANICHFVSGISQSNFCIFHNTTESVIIFTLNDSINTYVRYICDKIFESTRKICNYLTMTILIGRCNLRLNTESGYFMFVKMPNYRLP